MTDTPTVGLPESRKIGIDIGELPAHIAKIKKLIDDITVPLHQLSSTVGLQEGAVGVPKSSEQLEGGKSLFGTKTFYGGAGAIIAGVVSFIQWWTSGHDMSQLPMLITSVLATLGGGTAIYGRATATEKVK